MRIIVGIWKEINGQALRDRKAVNRLAAHNNPNNPYLKHHARYNHYIHNSLGSN